MRAYRVTGYLQYAMDAAVKVDRVQIADSAEQAIDDVVSRWRAQNAAGLPERRWSLGAIET